MRTSLLWGGCVVIGLIILGILFLIMCYLDWVQFRDEKREMEEDDEA